MLILGDTTGPRNAPHDPRTLVAVPRNDLKMSGNLVLVPEILLVPRNAIGPVFEAYCSRLLLVWLTPYSANLAYVDHRFESIRVGLMVGIGGGVPSTERDIQLGDVVTPLL